MPPLSQLVLCYHVTCFSGCLITGDYLGYILSSEPWGIILGSEILCWEVLKPWRAVEPEHLAAVCWGLLCPLLPFGCETPVQDPRCVPGPGYWRAVAVNVASPETQVHFSRCFLQSISLKRLALFAGLIAAYPSALSLASSLLEACLAFAPRQHCSSSDAVSGPQHLVLSCCPLYPH